MSDADAGRNLVEQIGTLDVQPGWRRLARGWLFPALALLYLLALFGWLQLRPEGLYERDGYYHARFANLLPQFGLSRQFHWTQASTWKEQFCDKEVLYHALMAPFATNSQEPLNGVRYYALILACGVFLTLFLVARAQGVPWPVLFALLPVCMGGLFLTRVLMIRSHVLSMILMLIGTHLLLRRNWKLLSVLGFIYAWSYTVPLALVMTALPVVCGRWVARGGLDWKSPLAALGGVVLGLAIHPYSPYTLETFLTYVQVMTLSSQSAPALELGNEIYSLPLDLFVSLMPLYGLSFTLLVLWGFWSWRKLTADTAGAMVAACFWFGMSLFFRRFTEYGPLLVALAVGLVVRDLNRDGGAQAFLKRHLKPAVAGGVLLLAILIGGHGLGVADTHRCMASAGGPRFRGAAKWMAEHLEPGETVAHLFWEEFTDLYYDAYRQNFIWGLDPTYTLRYDRDVALRLEDMRLKRQPVDPAWLATTFKARCLVMFRPAARMFPDLLTESWKVVYLDDTAVIFSLPDSRLVPRVPKKE